jgi:hypothetical protein
MFDGCKVGERLVDFGKRGEAIILNVIYPGPTHDWGLGNNSRCLMYKS